MVPQVIETVLERNPAMSDKISRDEFVKQTVANTIATYLQKYVAPWTTEEVHAQCVNDANKLADQLYGVLDGTTADRGKVLPQFQLPPPNVSAKMGASGTRRIRRLGR